jgi:predicted lipid-binding transport protein (Tim44 family)
MKKLLMALVVMAGSLALIAPEAEARRMGGGGSFGKQSQSFKRAAPPQQSQATNTAKPAAAGAAGAAKPSMMRNILGGALLGLGLGALLSHLGIGGALASMISTLLMVGLFVFAAMFIIRMIRNKNAGNGAGNNAQPSFANGYSARSNTPEIGSRVEPYGQPSALQSAAPLISGTAYQGFNQVPEDFDVPGFVRNAKTYFIRLQAAWDNADINDIRDFTTPEMFAELRLQLQERGATPNVTDVVSLDGEFYGVETVGDEYIASIKFTGMIKESEGASAEPFSEAWNLAKPVDGSSGWALAGIQQLS